MSERQKQDVITAFDGLKNAGNLDYVTCWYKKTAEFIKDTPIQAAFVSTNSICQGEQVPVLWPELMNRHGIKINFAHQTFKWWNEAKGKAAVYCVIIGFSHIERKDKKIFYYPDVAGNPVEVPASQINAYLLDASSVFIFSRSSPLCSVPEIGIGNKPIDGGNYLFTAEEKNAFIKQEPGAAVFFKEWVGSDEFINRYVRYCLWLGDADPALVRKMPKVMERVEAVKKFRLASHSEGTRKIADKPRNFHVQNMPAGSYIIIPRVSSEKRLYIPIGFLDSTTLASDSCHIIPDATLYHFGILTSGMHMAWTRYVCGRLEMRYRYSKDIVYNNFPWPQEADSRQKAAIEKAAQAVLDARATFPDASLADLYDPLTMPPALVKAHQKLDKAVEKAYGSDRRSAEFTNDADRVAHLFYLYQTMTEGLMAKKTRRKNL
jgi:hypothetical protein